MSRRSYSPKRRRSKGEKSYNLRSSCDGESCDELHTAELCSDCSEKVDILSHHHCNTDSRSSSSPIRPRRKRQPKKMPQRRRVSKKRRNSGRRSKSSSSDYSHSRSSSSSRSYSSPSSRRSTRRSRHSRRKKASKRATIHDSYTSSSTDSGRSTSSSKHSRRSSRDPRVSFNLSANTLCSFSSSSPTVAVSPYRSSSRSTPRTSTPISTNRERSRSSAIIIPPSREREMSPICSTPSTPSNHDENITVVPIPEESVDDNMNMGQGEKLLIEGDLDVKTVTLFYIKEGRLVVDSQVIIAPKGITPEEMKWQVQRLRANNKVYVHGFADGEDELELMEVSVMTSTKTIFIRRVSKMSQIGNTKTIFCHHPTNRICPVNVGGEGGVLNLEDIYSVTRSETTMWRREKFVVSFGRNKPDSRQLQQEMKAAVAMTPPDGQPLFMGESVHLTDTKNLVVEKNMRLEKACWSQADGWKERIVKSYTVNPVSSGETPIMRSTTADKK